MQITNVNYDQNKVHINGLKFNCYKGRSAGLKGEQKHRNEYNVLTFYFEIH